MPINGSATEEREYCGDGSPQTPPEEKNVYEYE